MLSLELNWDLLDAARFLPDLDVDFCVIFCCCC